MKLEPISSPFLEETQETFEQKNERLKRPLSPHLTIYKPQLTSLLSITHRITGIALIGYAIAIVLCKSLYYLLVNVDSVYSNSILLFSCKGSKYSSPGQIVTFIQGLNLPYSAWITTKFFIILPFTYHTMNGVRHLVSIILNLSTILVGLQH